MPRTTTPRSIPGKSERSCCISSKVAIEMPSQGRLTYPLVMSWEAISFAVLEGIANPTPWLLPLISVLMPMTCQSISQSGPPLLPGFIDVSVWMNSS